MWLRVCIICWAAVRCQALLTAPDRLVEQISTRNPERIVFLMGGVGKRGCKMLISWPNTTSHTKQENDDVNTGQRESRIPDQDFLPRLSSNGWQSLSHTHWAQHSWHIPPTLFRKNPHCVGRPWDTMTSRKVMRGSCSGAGAGKSGTGKKENSSSARHYGP